MRPPGQERGRGLLSEDRDPPPPGYTRDLTRDRGDAMWKQLTFLGNPEHGVSMAPPDLVKIVKAMLDESSFGASPGHVIRGKVGEGVTGPAGKLRDRAHDKHPR
jgi:hypothetical protein